MPTTQSKPKHSNNEESTDSSGSQEEGMYGSVLQPVPVVIIGSHYDQVPVDKQAEVVANTQRLVDEMRQKFGQYLEVSEILYPLNCLKAVSPEIRVLKERLCVVRSKLLEVGLAMTLFCIQ